MVGETFEVTRLMMMQLLCMQMFGERMRETGNVFSLGI